MTYKPALLHPSKVHQEFQRLARYLNYGTGGSSVSGGVLSVRGSVFYSGATDASTVAGVTFIPTWTLTSTSGTHGVTLQASDTQALLPAGTWQVWSYIQFAPAVEGTDAIVEGHHVISIGNTDTPGEVAVSNMMDLRNLRTTSDGVVTVLQMTTPIFTVTSTDQYIEPRVAAFGTGNYRVGNPYLYIVRLG